MNLFEFSDIFRPFYFQFPSPVLGVGVGVGVGTGVGVGVGVGVGMGVGVGTGVPPGVGEGVGEGVAVGTGVGEGVGEGVGSGVINGVGPGFGKVVFPCASYGTGACINCKFRTPISVTPSTLLFCPSCNSFAVSISTADSIILTIEASVKANCAIGAR